MCQIFSIHTMPEEFQIVTITSHSGKLGQGNHIIIMLPSVSKSFISKMFFVYPKMKTHYIFKFLIKLSFLDGLVWTVWLNQRIGEAVVSNFSASVQRCYEELLL